MKSRNSKLITQDADAPKSKRLVYGTTITKQAELSASW